jgi:hypothetical protein
MGGENLVVVASFDQRECLKRRQRALKLRSFEGLFPDKNAPANPNRGSGPVERAGLSGF